MKKNIKSLAALIFVLVAIISSSLFLTQKTSKTLDTKSTYLGKFLTSSEGSFYTTKDENIKILMNTYAKNINYPKNIKEENKFEDNEILYYNSDLFLLGSGFYKYTYNLFSTKTGTKLATECSMLKYEGFQNYKDIIISTYPEYIQEGTEKGFCLFSKDTKSLKYIDLKEVLKENEVLVKNVENSYTTSVFKVNEVKREIVAKVFDKNIKEIDASNKYVRDLVFSY